MALSLAKAAPLKPEIRLAQALSEFEAALPDDKKTKLRTYRGQLPPNPTDVIRFTAEIDRDAGRNRRSRQCVGPRLTNILNAVQQFSTVVDPIASQSHIASAIWGTVKISLQLASAISNYFDQLSTLFMRIGCTSPRYQDFGLLYPESTKLQSALCEYFVVIVCLCKQAVLFLKKPFWSQLPYSILKPFESEFGSFQQNLEIRASAIRDEVSLASGQVQQNEAKEMSRFRAFMFAKNFSDTSTVRRRRKKAELQLLNACSVYDHEKSWKQARKGGNTSWICHDEGYKQWKNQKISGTLWCTGILGSGKTVLSANVVEDLKTTTPAAVAYFFCRHDEAESLVTRTIVGSIARQIFDHIKSDIVDAITEMRPGAIDTDQILKYLHTLLPSNSQNYFVIIDGLDECKEEETRLILRCLKQLLMSTHTFQVYCSSRPDVFRWTRTLLEPQWNVSMPQTSADIEDYIEDALMKHLDSGKLSVGNSTIILTIQDALLKKAHGMFLWVVFQIDSICAQKTDEAILTALEDLPKDLPETFNRILRNLQHSNAADPQFCRKIFDLVAAVQRPLTLEELREAVSIKTEETSWDPSKLANDVQRWLSDSCGSLMAIDEEHLTVHFTHHSVKQHLVSGPMDPDIKEYRINTKDADLCLGGVIVTYLNFRIFDRQLAKADAKSTMLSEVSEYPSAILGSTLPRSNIANRLAMRLLKSRRNSRIEIHSQLNSVVTINDGSEEQIRHPFLLYAQEYWLFHTRFFNPKVKGYCLWQRLIQGEVEMIELPWTLISQDSGDKYMEWVIQNEHWALINRELVLFINDPKDFPAANHLLKALEEKAWDVDIENIYFAAALYLALFLDNEAVVLLSLRKGADVNARVGPYGTVLQAASYFGIERMARLLLENGANPNAKAGRYGTALYIASSYDGDRTIAELLLEIGADVNAKGGEYGTALQAAPYDGHEEVVILLLENGADTNAKGGEYGTALQAASYYGHGRIVRLLLDNGANVNAEGGKYVTALQAALFDGHEEVVRLLLENGANVNLESRGYGTSLQLASTLGLELKIVRLLLENGANVNAEGGSNGTALQIASEKGYEEIVRLLLANGANVNAEGRIYGNALQKVSEKGYIKIVRLLLRNGANVNAEGGKYGNALQAASYHGHEAVVRLLLESGANVNAEGGRYGNALQAASCDYGHEAVVRLLLENGANVNAEGGRYGTVLQIASYQGHEAVVRFLLENGADVNAQGGGYGNALQAASYHGHEAVARLLLENGANVNAKGGEYGNALQAASYRGHEAVVRFLLENGADVNAQGGGYGNALRAAIYSRSEELVRLLLKNGATANKETMKAASRAGGEEVQNLIRNALKS